MKKDFKLYKNIISDEELTSIEKIIYSYYQFTTSGELNINPSKNRLAKILGVSRTKLFESIKNLISIGRIKNVGNSIVAVTPQTEYYKCSFDILQSKLNYSSKFLLSYLISNNKNTYSSNKTICDDLNISLGTLQSALNQLEKNSIISRGNTSYYNQYETYVSKRVITINTAGLMKFLGKEMLVVQTKEKVAVKPSNEQIPYPSELGLFAMVQKGNYHFN